MRSVLRDSGTALNFGAAGATTNILTYPSTVALSAANLTAFTYAVWIKPRTAGGASIGRISDGAPFALYTGVSGVKLRFQADVLHTTTAGSSITSATYEFGLWMRVLVTWSDTDLRPVIYVNGVADNASGTNKAGTRNATANPLTVGNRGDLVRNFNGEMDRYCIWNRVLTAAEIANDAASFVPPTSGLVSYKRFDEGSGTTAIDQIDTALNGTISGASYITDKISQTRSVATSRLAIQNFNGSLSFNGTSSLVTMPNNQVAVSGGSNYSISAWFKPTNLAGGAIYGEGSTSDDDPLLIIGPTVGNKLRVFKRDSARVVQLNSIVSNTVISRGLWQHFVWTDTGGTGKLYINGVLDSAVFTYAFSTTVMTNAYIGAVNHLATTSDYYSGSIADVRVFNSLLTVSDVTKLYVQGTGIATDRYKLDEGGGTTALDSAGANNGTITAGTYVTDVPSKRRQVISTARGVVI
jgi:hypothetical protein